VQVGLAAACLGIVKIKSSRSRERGSLCLVVALDRAGLGWAWQRLVYNYF
jgi:hypothetical protein